MSELFRTVLNASFQGSVVICAVMVARLALRKAPKKYICILWMLAMLRLLMPLSLESSLSLQPEGEVVTETQWRQLQTYGQILPEDGTMELPAEIEADKDSNWATVAPNIWMIGMVGMLLYSLLSYVALKFQLREAIRISDNIWESDRIRTAFVLGYFRPLIYLPYGLKPEYRELVLEHERCHLKRLDHWLKLIMFVVLSVHWFNPLAWAAYALLCTDTEFACDELVIRDMDLGQRKLYSAALLACGNNVQFAVSPVGFGEKPIKKRIVAVLNYQKPTLWVKLLAIGAAVAIAVCFLTNPKV